MFSHITLRIIILIATDSFGPALQCGFLFQLFHSAVAHCTLFPSVMLTKILTATNMYF